MLVSLIVARPFPYAADGLNTKTVMPGQTIAVDPALASGLLAEGLCLAPESDKPPAAPKAAEPAPAQDLEPEPVVTLTETDAAAAPEPADHEPEPEPRPRRRGRS